MGGDAGARHRPGRTRAASGENSAAAPYGGYQETPDGRLRTRKRRAASGPGEMPAVSTNRSGHDLPGVWPGRRPGLNASPWGGQTASVPTIQDFGTSIDGGHGA